VTVVPKRIDNLVVKIAERCNLGCHYCYLYEHGDQTYQHRPKFMSEEIFDATLDVVGRWCDASPGRQMGLTFHGGEPTLIGPERFERLAHHASDKLGSRLSSLRMQTNGTLINQRWIQTLCRTRVHASVSIDGPPDVHDRDRVDRAGRGSYQAVVRGIRLLQDAGLSPGALAVVMPGQDGGRVYRHLRALGFTSIDMLLPDVTHDSRNLWYGNCGSLPVAQYLIPAFDAWFDEDDPKVTLRIFYGLLRRMLGGPLMSDTFGNPILSYLIIETDGSIQPNDALRSCQNGITLTDANVREQGFEALHRTAPLAHQLLTDGLPLSDTCRNCAEVAVCGGGYAPHRYAQRNGFDNPSVWCADIMELLSHMRARTGLQPSSQVAARA
jgi:uncharacterized protein